MPPRHEPQPALGRAIRTLREQRGMTQEELAHAADTHPTWISHLESGRNNPAWGTVRRLAAALGVSVSELAALAERANDE
jgi:transcriptional regulator with XRE-family HTH domain